MAGRAGHPTRCARMRRRAHRPRRAGRAVIIRLAFHLRDTAAFLRIINTPPRGIGETTIAQIQALARRNHLTLWEALEEMLTRAKEAPLRAARALASFHALIRTLAEEGKSLRMTEFFRSLLDRTGYVAMLKDQNTPESEGRVENLLELVNAVAAAEEAGEGLTAFLDRAALVSDTDDYDERARVTLMTLHSAKGLEFEAVFLAGLEEGLLPHKMSMDDDAGLEEERRLCYVGMTRAKDRLVLSSSATRRFWGEEGRRNTRRSRFLGEIPDKFTERLSSSGRVETSWEGSLNSRESIERFLQTTGFDSRLQARRTSAPTASGSRWRRGSRVRHPKYGIGTVIACEGEGEQEKLTISFPGYGAKKMLPHFAALEKA